MQIGNDDVFDATEGRGLRVNPSDGESPHKGKTGLRRIWNAMFYSMEGLRAAYRHEDAFRQEVLLAIVLIPLALFLPASGLGKALMIASVFLVLIVELLNSAVEATVDRVSLEHHKLAKRAKDIGSAAVMMSLANVVAVWVLVLFG
jgi:diacylglycerol kinase (ATP)